MKLISAKIQNFRGYKDCIEIPFTDLTAFVGRNDVGKSTILDALDIFFNDKYANNKMEKSDVNVYASDDDEVVISACFSELPSRVVLDASYETTLEAEYLLNQDGKFEIVKKYKNGSITPRVYIRAHHPTNPECSDLLLKKQSELKSIIRTQGIPCDNQTVNAVMRSAIWNYYTDNLKLDDIEIDTSKEDAKRTWDNIASYLPVYSLFRADRKNDDGDSEVQDPLREAVKQILTDAELQRKLSEVAEEVSKTLQDVSERTLAKLREMNPEVANTLNPKIPPVENLKWVDVFKNVSITGDNDIPLNKRGGGVKKLILLNFFRAEAERKKEATHNGVIYAIEEPETSQHSDNQRLLINAFKEISTNMGNQVIITTHSPVVVKSLDMDSIRLVLEHGDNSKSVHLADSRVLQYLSLNEVSYIAFGEATEEYHDELYGFIEHQVWRDEFFRAQTETNRPYSKHKNQRDQTIITQNLCLSEYVRHQIHHSDNDLNDYYTHEDLVNSIARMRDFINTKLSAERQWMY